MLAAGASKLAAPASVAPVTFATAGGPEQVAEGFEGGAKRQAGEVFLMETLAFMDQHMQFLRERKQGLVATVELACRRVLGPHFGRLDLVGSAAIRVETLGSDVDVVCFTSASAAAAGMAVPADVLRRIYAMLRTLVAQWATSASDFSLELIDDARVPILRVLYGPHGNAVALDISVDQLRPVEHVRWFQSVGAAPRPFTPAPGAAPLVTLMMRCVKWWIRARQIPRTKEGGLPTIAWLLMAVHVCSRPEATSGVGGMAKCQWPMAALLSSLADFFNTFSGVRGLDGVLRFSADGSSSEFQRRVVTKRAEIQLSVLDPTQRSKEGVDLAPRLTAATHLLLAYELDRAARALWQMDRVFELVPEDLNSLPTHTPVGGVKTAVLVLLPGRGPNMPSTLELGFVTFTAPKPGWSAPFLHRADNRSSVDVKLLDVDEGSGLCVLRAKVASLSLHPSHFVCGVRLDVDASTPSGWRLDVEGLERIRAMRTMLQADEGQWPPAAAEDAPERRAQELSSVQ